MATVENITRSVYDMGVRDNMSAGAKAAADAMQKATEAVVANEQAVTRSTRTAATWVNKTDEVTKASNALAKAQRDLETAQKAFATSAGSSAPAADAQARSIAALEARVQAAREKLAALNVAYGPAASGTASVGVAMATTASQAERFATSTRATSQQLAQLTPQLNDLFVQIAGGQGLFMPLIQQGPQITQIFGGMRNTLGALASALGPVGIGIAALAAVVGGTIMVFNSQQGILSDLRAQLRLLPGDYRAAAVEVEAMARQMAASTPGLSAGDARAGIVAVRQAASRADLSLPLEAQRDLIKLSQDLARVTGTDLAEAFRTIGNAMRDPAAFVENMARNGVPGFNQELRRSVEVLQIGGDRATAFGLAMSRAGSAMSGMAQDVAPATQAMNGLRQEWERFTQLVTPFLAGVGARLLSWLTDAARLAGTFATAISALGNLRFPTIDANGGGNTTTVTSGSGYSNPGESFAQALARQESGNNPTRMNEIGAVGRLQFMPSRLQELGFYSGGAGWSGSFSIPGFDNVRTVNDFRFNAQAQAVVEAAHLARLEAAARGAIASAPDGSSIGGIGLNVPGLMGVAHLGGEAGMRRFVSSGGQYNPSDANGTSLADYFRSFSRVAEAAAAAAATAATPAAAQAAATAVTNSGASGATASTEDILNRALRLARGDDSPYAPGSGVDARRAGLEAGLRALDAGAQRTTDPASLDMLTEAQRRFREELERTQTPQQEAIERLRLQGVAAGTVDAAQRRFTQGMAEWEDQMRRSGAQVTDEQRNAYRSELLRQINADLRVNIELTERQTSAQGRIAQAYLRSLEAGRQQELVERARTEVIGSSVGSTEESTRRINERVVALEREARAASDNAAAQDAARGRQDLDRLQDERNAIGRGNAGVIDIAGYAERRRLRYPDTEAGQTAILNARQVAEANLQTRQLQNSWNELASVGERSFDRIGEAITQGLTQGRISMQNLGNIANAIVSEIIQAFFKLAILNPILNELFGGSRGTLGGLGSVISSMLSGTGGGGGSSIAAGQIYSAPIGPTLGSALGNAFSGGHLIPFAAGGIVDRTTVVPMAMMGEAGPEAIIPLKRRADGTLGVGSDGGGGGHTQNNVFHIDARGADQGVDQKIRIGIAIAIDQANKRMIADIERGGSAARAVGRRR